MLRDQLGLGLLEVIQGQMQAQEKEIAATNARPILWPRRLLSIRGIGQILAPVIAAEVDSIERFRDAISIFTC